MNKLYLALSLAIVPMVSEAMQTYDIFKNSFSTRRLAKSTEHRNAMMVGRGCAGFLIAPRVGMSAAHCQRAGNTVTSGIALLKGQAPDGRITKTIEVGTFDTYDFWIFEVEWRGNKFPRGMRIVPRVQTHYHQVKDNARDNNGADMIYTLGFPGDISKGRLIYSFGYVKTDGSRNRLMLNNVSLINGNSGGGIWRNSDNMLVSIVSGGPHMLGQPGWDNSDWHDPKHWNWGPPIWRVYQSSRALQYLFPRGENRLSRRMAVSLRESGIPMAAGF